MIYIGSDHRGFELKEKIKSKLNSSGYVCTDKGSRALNLKDDYADYAIKVAVSVSENPEHRGILLCGSGAGVDITANKVPGVRSALAINTAQVRQAREHDDVNILSLAADYISESEAWDIIQVFLVTPFSGEERHLRRLLKIKEVERGLHHG